jgi:uncharacterized membrane protein YfcA
VEVLESLGWLTIAWAAFALALAGFVHGLLGLGFPLIATPLVAMATGIKTAVIIVVVPTLVIVIAAIVVGGRFMPTIREWWRMPIWMAIGGVTGANIYLVADAAPLTLLLALAILIYLSLDFLGHGQSKLIADHRHKFGAVFGFFGGFFEGSVNIAAPPLLIYFLSLGLAPAMLVKALNLCFFTGKSAQLSTLMIAGNVTIGTWLAVLPLSVVGVGTLLIGMRIRDRVDALTYRRWLKIALCAMAAILIGQFVVLLQA